MVGAAGFEPATSGPPVQRANQAAPRPDRLRHRQGQNYFLATCSLSALPALNLGT